MKEYHKIQSIYKRHPETKKFIEGEFSLPEFEYLQNNQWGWTEKVDGTNIRVMWEPEGAFSFAGKTDNAQIPIPLSQQLQKIFSVEGLREALGDTPACLYGEGYGAKIQKGGGNYKADGVDFVLFDILIGQWWLKRSDVNDIGAKLGIHTIPVVGWGNVDAAIKMVKGGIESKWGPFEAEGLVLRPLVELKTRSGERIITKIKSRDFVSR